MSTTSFLPAHSRGDKGKEKVAGLQESVKERSGAGGWEKGKMWSTWCSRKGGALCVRNRGERESKQERAGVREPAREGERVPRREQGALKPFFWISESYPSSFGPSVSLRKKRDVAFHQMILSLTKCHIRSPVRGSSHSLSTCACLLLASVCVLAFSVLSWNVPRAHTYAWKRRREQGTHHACTLLTIV